MKKILIFLLAVSSMPATAQVQYFGKKIDESGAITMEMLKEKTKDGNEVRAKVTGKIEEVCQTKGCWITLDKGDGTTMRVKFKDYGFFVPKNAAGKTVIMEGRAFFKTVTVAELKHYAEDAGKTKEEIEAINEPDRMLSFEADGVIIKD